MNSIDRDTGSSRRAIRRSVGYVLAFPGLVAGTLVCLMAGSALALAGPLVVRRLIDEGISKQDVSRLTLFAMVFLIVESLRTAAEMSQTYLLRRLSHSTTASLRRDVFRHLQGLPLSWFDTNPAGRIVARTTGDVAALGDALSGGMIGLFRDLLVFLGVSVLVLSVNPRFGAITLVSSLLVAIPAVLIRRSAQRRSALALDAVARTNTVLEENIAGHAVIQLFGIEAARGERYRSENQNLLQVSLSTLRMRVFFDAGASVVSALALTLIIGLGGAGLAAGRISLGLLVAFIQYGSYLLGSVRGIAEKGVAVLSGISAGERVFETLDLPPALPTQGTSETGRDLERGLVISDLRFGYRPGMEVLKGISAAICPGEHVALVGKTGAGKTTLARLVARLYDPWQGMIRWEGRDLRNIPSTELRRDVAFVTQQVSIFPDTVLENIRLGDPRVGRLEIAEACQAVNAHRFIERLPLGLDTPLSPGGVELSVGERQLLAFARVLVRQANLLILDEPTANVDHWTEQWILEALRRVTEARTSIIIAHRFATLRDASRVWVMDQGQIVEEGAPPELISKSGVFHRMAEQHRVPMDAALKRSACHGE